jgi:hypothetical protein
LYKRLEQMQIEKMSGLATIKKNLEFLQLLDVTNISQS